VSSDHGNDPTAPGTDHTREYVPLVAYSKSLVDRPDPIVGDVGIRDGFNDIAYSLGDWLGIDWKGPGSSFVDSMERVRN